MTSVVVRGDRRAFAALAAIPMALLTVAGCSSSGSSSSSAAAPVPSASPATASATPGAAAASSGAAPVASMAPLAAAAGQLTGTQLESVLVPASDFPVGFATPTSGPITSGGSLTSGPATYNLATISCATFIQHLGTVGFGETAMVSGSLGAAGQAYDQLIYQFGTSSAASAFVAGVRALAGRCGSFTATANGSKGTFSLRATPGTAVGGHPTLELRQGGTLGASKLVLDTLLCASGVDVFAASGVGVGGAAAPARPARETVVYNLMKRQAAVAVLG
ncbi:MAG: hypothetical protein ACRDOI_32785 [Trebonia sp.]